MTELSPSQTPPREATREHRRLIALKLEEVYLGEGDGYSAGWTDERVAQDLSMPRAWVVDVREFAFGPAISRQAPDELLGKLTALEGKISALGDEIVEARTELQRLDTTLASLVIEAADLRKQGTALAKLAGAR